MTNRTYQRNQVSVVGMLGRGLDKGLTGIVEGTLRESSTGMQFAAALIADEPASDRERKPNGNGRRKPVVEFSVPIPGSKYASDIPDKGRGEPLSVYRDHVRAHADKILDYTEDQLERKQKRESSGLPY